MAAHACLKNEIMKDEKYYNLMSWLRFCQQIFSNQIPEGWDSWKVDIRHNRETGLFVALHFETVI